MNQFTTIKLTGNIPLMFLLSSYLLVCLSSILTETSKMEYEYESLGLLHDMFTRQALKTPNKIAIHSVDNREVTYKELNEWSDALATALKNRGVLPNTPVGLYLEKGIEFVVTYIAALKSGKIMMMNLSINHRLSNELCF